LVAGTTKHTQKKLLENKKKKSTVLWLPLLPSSFAEGRGIPDALELKLGGPPYIRGSNRFLIEESADRKNTKTIEVRNS